MPQFNHLAASLLRIDASSAPPEVEGRLKRAVEALPERERTIVVRRWGLDGSKRASLFDLGVDLGLTRERVRQLEVHALAHLRTALEDVV